ncbi:MAG: hypothetical protein ABA06_02215 [Parcubacteria bacterium C7867-001]|nr:MAG: hypothetical protein ABA06_02215 [Parcubacteria bacterium C7867-001]
MATRDRNASVSNPAAQEGGQVARIDTDAFGRGKIMSRAERRYGKENLEALLAATGEKLSDGVGLVNDKEDDLVLQVLWVHGFVKSQVAARNGTASMKHYLNGVFGNPSAKKPRGPNAKAATALRNAILAKLADKVSAESGIMFNLRVDGTTEEAHVLHDVLYYAGELLSDEKREEYEQTECWVRFLGGSSVTEPVELGAWLTNEAATGSETTDTQTHSEDDIVVPENGGPTNSDSNQEGFGASS